MRGKTALIFLGNSTASSFDVGVSKVILKKIIPDIVIANSMGSANASFIFKDKNFSKNIEELENIWKTYDVSRTFRFNKEILYKGLFAGALYSNKGLKELFGEYCNFRERRIEDSAVPLFIGAIENETGKPVLLSKGSVFDAVMASCSAPFFFPPYEIEGKTYIDGGLNSRYCIDFAISKGCDKIYVINLAKKRKKDNHLFSKIVKCIDIMKYGSVECFQHDNPKVIMISPDEKELPKSFTDTLKIHQLITHGEKKAEEILQ